jgi:hypothetical protein
MRGSVSPCVVSIFAVMVVSARTRVPGSSAALLEAHPARTTGTRPASSNALTIPSLSATAIHRHPSLSRHRLEVAHSCHAAARFTRGAAEAQIAPQAACGGGATCPDDRRGTENGCRSTREGPLPSVARRVGVALSPHGPRALPGATCPVARWDTTDNTARVTASRECSFHPAHWRYGPRRRTAPRSALHYPSLPTRSREGAHRSMERYRTEYRSSGSPR